MSICPICKNEFPKPTGRHHNKKYCGEVCHLRANKAYYKKYREINRKKININQNKNKTIRSLKQHNKLKQDKIELFQLLGGKCNNPDCPIPIEKMDIRCLQVDHINGKGCKERKQYGRGSTLYRNILKKVKAGSKDYQLLCVYCNWLKSFEQKERPLIPIILVSETKVENIVDVQTKL
jgi:hypothetical protein